MRETAQLTGYLAGLRFDDLPPAAVAMSKLAIKDTMGVAIFGSALDWSRMAADFAKESGGPGKATIWGTTGSTSAPFAALANGTAAHGIEMDDRIHGLEGHNGAGTVSAAIAAAERSGASGQDLLLGVACGYETTFRVSRAARRTSHFYASTWTILGAATAAAKVLGLDQRGLSNTLGIAGSTCSGISEFNSDPLGTMVKRLQGGGWPAHCGVTSASLAQRGFTGPSSVLEGAHGVLRSFCTEGEPDMEALVRGLGDRFEIENWQTKAYACWGGSHTTVEALYQLRDEHGVTPDQIKRISVGCGSKILYKAKRIAPESILTAQHNLPFIIGAALHHDLHDPAVWEESILSDARIDAVADLVEVHVDDEVEEFARSTPGEHGSRVTLKLDDGRTVSTLVRYAKGNPGNLMTAADVDAKFRLLAGHVLPQDRLERLLMYVDGLDEDAGPVALGEIWRE